MVKSPDCVDVPGIGPIRGEPVPGKWICTTVSRQGRIMSNDHARYHMRRSEKKMSDDEARGVLLRGKYATFALCKDDEPYLVTLNYAFVPEENCLYCHAAPEGKKIDFIRANPRVWGQVLEDGGYLPGQCDHAYRTVMFRARAELLDGDDAKRRALVAMIDRLEPNPGPNKARILSGSLDEVALIRIVVETLDGKQNPVSGKP